MKKFMFSAVALVAFSFAGMANNSVEKVEKEIKVEEVKEEITLRVDCVELAASTYSDWGGGSQAMAMAMQVYSSCKVLNP